MRQIIRITHSIDKQRNRKDPKTAAGIRTLSIDDHTTQKLRQWKMLQAGLLRARRITQSEGIIVCGTNEGKGCDPDRFSKWFRSFCVQHHFGLYVDKEGNPLPVLHETKTVSRLMKRTVRSRG